MSAVLVTVLLRLSLKTTYFVYVQVFHIQTEGAAMGSPVSPIYIVANLYMENCEEKVITLHPQQLIFWGRYVDDALSDCKTTLIHPLTDRLNSIYDKIQWTVEH